jgi:salicylate hydroxylase
MERVPQEILEPPSGIFIGPGHLVNRYPVRNGELLNFVAFAERASGRRKAGRSARRVRSCSTSSKAGRPGCGASWSRCPGAAVQVGPVRPRAADELESRGRVTLLGDAAHPVLPFLGHGAVLAIEDGVVLARAFAASDSVEEALRATRPRGAARCVRRARIAQGRQAVPRPDTDTYRERMNGKAADEGIGLFSYNPVTQVGVGEPGAG